MPEPTAASAESRRGRLTDVLRNRAFLRLWLVQALSQTGQNMINFALLVLVGSVVERGGISQANTAISFTVLSFSLPGILLSPVAGVVVERTNKRTALVVTNALRGLATVGFLMIDPSWRPLLALTVLYALAFLSGGVGQFFGPALGATIPALVPERNIVNANALFNLTFTASQVAGFAALGPFLIKLFGLDTVFSGIIGTFALCTALSLTLPSTPPRPTRAPGPSHPFLQFLDDVREGIAFIFATPLLTKAIAYLSLATASYLMVAVLGPGFVATVLLLPPQDIALLIAPAGLGVLAGVLAVGRVAHYLGEERTIDWGIAAAGAILILLALVEPITRLLWRGQPGSDTPTLVVAGALAFLLGVANAMILAPSQSLLQAGSPEHIRARVYATFFTVSNSVAFMPIVFAGALADLFGVVKVLVALGLVLLATGAYQLALKPRATR